MMHERETAIDEGYRRTRKSDNEFKVPPWIWTLVISLLVNIIGAAFVTGRVTEKLDGVSYRVERLESQIDKLLHP